MSTHHPHGHGRAEVLVRCNGHPEPATPATWLRDRLVSGGSFNYLCHSWDLSDLVSKRSHLEAMAEELERLSWAKDAAKETRHLVADLNAIEVRVEVALERLRPVWKAVEWWRSCDWSEDQVREAVTEFQGGQPDSEGAPDTLAMDLLRRVYEMLRDSTPGPLTDDMPVRPLLREARSFLDQFGSDDG